MGFSRGHHTDGLLRGKCIVRLVHERKPRNVQADSIGDRLRSATVPHKDGVDDSLVRGVRHGLQDVVPLGTGHGEGHAGCGFAFLQQEIQVLELHRFRPPFSRNPRNASGFLLS